MFTGLVREIGTLTALTPRSGVVRLDLHAPQCAPSVVPGDSLAVNGICLTVTARRGEKLAVEAAAETRRVTTLLRWRVGQRLHLEPALRLGDALGGHLMLGHVDGVGTVKGKQLRGGSLFLTVGLAPELARYLLPKGSVAIDGVSLTVDSGPFTDRFTVNVIPHTLAQTTLSGLRPGSRVNLEMDILVKAARGEGLSQTLRKLTAAESRPDQEADQAAPLTLEQITAHGFRRRRSRGV